MTIEKATSQWKESFIAIRNIPRFLNLVYKSNRRLFILNLILRLIKAFMPVALLWIGKEIIDEIILQAGQVDKEFTRIFTLIILEFTLALLSDVFSRIISMTDGLIGDLYANESSVELIQKTAKVELAQLEDSEFYDKLERARRQTTNRISLMSDVMGQAQDLITIVSLISALIYFYPLLIILLAISIIPSFLNEIKFSNSSYSLQRRWTPERRELDYMRMIGASDVTAKEVKLFGLTDFISDTFARVADKYFQANKKLAVQRTFWGITYNIIGDIAYYSAYVFIVLKAVAGAVTIGDLTFLAGSFNRLRNQMQGMFSRFTRISQSALYLQDYFDFIDMEFQYDTGFERKILPTEIQTGFEFKDVSFRYPGTEVDVLKSISFHLDKNEKLALVGENGAGKTTLVKLMLRLYEPTAGAILMDGVDIRHYDKAEYQQLFGAIFQDFVKYYLTAKVNIAVGNIEELENQKRIEESAVRSLASEVIEELPNGYEQELGKRFRSGTELSGGQWQKIALARAYMTDAPVIILDEPTAALDARAEYEVFQRFIGLTKGKISIIISHRFSTVRMADRILVLSGGEILEIGSHKQLLANKQLYSELFNLQAAGYK